MFDIFGNIRDRFTNGTGGTTPAVTPTVDNADTMPVPATSGNADAGNGTPAEIATPELGELADTDATPEPDTETDAGTPASGVGDVTPVGGDEVGGDEVGGDEVGGDEVGGDEVGGDEVGGDEVGGDQAAQLEETQRALVTALAQLDGRLADPADLPFSPELTDPGAVADAISDLIASRPGLRARHVHGDIGAGKRGAPVPHQFDIMDVIRDLSSQ